MDAKTPAELVAPTLQCAGQVAHSSNNFTLLRLVMALLVVFSHSYPLLGRAEPMILATTAGGFAVHCFFAMSGYLIVGSFVTTNNALLFSWKRFLRIVPALVIAVPISFLLYDWQNGYAGNPMPGPPNGPLWTISWEALMYVLTHTGFRGDHRGYCPRFVAVPVAIAGSIVHNAPAKRDRGPWPKRIQAGSDAGWRR